MCPNCVNSKMLESDWFLAVHIYVRFNLFNYQELVIGQVKPDS